VVRTEVDIQEITPDYYLASIEGEPIGIGIGHPSRWMRDVILAIADPDSQRGITFESG